MSRESVTDVMRKAADFLPAQLAEEMADVVGRVRELMWAAYQGLDSIPRPTGRNGERASYNTVRDARERLIAALASCQREGS